MKKHPFLIITLSIVASLCILFAFLLIARATFGHRDGQRGGPLHGSSSSVVINNERVVSPTWWAWLWSGWSFGGWGWGGGQNGYHRQDDGYHYHEQTRDTYHREELRR